MIGGLVAGSRLGARALGYRALRYLNLPEVAEELRFRQLRARYYDDFWSRAARSIAADYRIDRFGYGRVTRGSLATFVRRDRVMLDSALTLDVAGNKALTYEIGRAAGLAMPAACAFDIRDLGPGLAFLAEAAGPLVVKPMRGTGGGRGVTTGILSEGDFRRACRRAARFDERLLAEHQIEGRSFRLLYVGGAMIDAIERDPPFVIGDGRTTISRLAAAETAARLTAPPYRALSPLRLDDEARTFLAATGRRPADTPADGEVVVVKRVVNQNDRRGHRRVHDRVHPDTVRAGAALAAALGVEFAGVDVMCRDISRPLGGDNGLLAEVNTTPGLHHHDLVEGATADVGAAVLDYMFATGRGTMRVDGRLPETGHERPHAA